MLTLSCREHHVDVESAEGKDKVLHRNWDLYMQLESLETAEGGKKFSRNLSTDCIKAIATLFTDISVISSLSTCHRLCTASQTQENPEEELITKNFLRSAFSRSIRAPYPSCPVSGTEGRKGSDCTTAALHNPHSKVSCSASQLSTPLALAITVIHSYTADGKHCGKTEN